jgi:hypothetical protein
VRQRFSVSTVVASHAAVRSVVLIALFVSGCRAAYASHDVVIERDVDPQSLQSLGCLEVAFGLQPRAHEEDAALIVTRFGNRCLHPTPFNLASARFSGVDREGRAVSLSLVDPRNEIQPLHLDSGAQGVERVRLAGPHNLTAICIDVRNVAEGAAASPFCLRPSTSYYAVTE